MFQDKGHNAECLAFVDAVRRGGPPPISCASLAATTRASFGAMASLANGQPVEQGPLG